MSGKNQLQKKFFKSCQPMNGAGLSTSQHSQTQSPNLQLLIAGKLLASLFTKNKLDYAVFQTPPQQLENYFLLDTPSSSLKTKA